jgi:hypothetical protein
VAEGARLESVYTARYPGFESLSLRHRLFLCCPRQSQGAEKTPQKLKKLKSQIVHQVLWNLALANGIFDGS